MYMSSMLGQIMPESLLHAMTQTHAAWDKAAALVVQSSYAVQQRFDTCHL